MAEKSVLTIDELEYVRDVNEFFLRQGHTKYYCFYMPEKREAVRVANELRSLDYFVSVSQNAAAFHLSVSQKEQTK